MEDNTVYDEDGNIIWLCSVCNDPWSEHDASEKVACNSTFVSTVRNGPLLIKKQITLE